jgi:septum formation protein
VPDAVRPPISTRTPKGELPRPYCARIAAEKVAAVEAGEEDVVLCADTTVALGRRILGKPADAAEAEAFLRALSGRRHRVFTGVAVKRGARVWERVVESRVKMKQLSQRRDRRLPRHRRLAGQGGGIFHPGACRGVHPVDLGQPFGDRGPAAGGNGDAAGGGRGPGLGGA